MEYRSQGLLLGLVLVSTPSIGAAQGSGSQLCANNAFDLQRAQEFGLLPESCGGSPAISASLCGGDGPPCKTYYGHQVATGYSGSIAAEGRGSSKGI